MIRFSWLQARTQMVVALAGLVVVAVITAVTGPHLLHLYHLDLTACTARGNCTDTLQQFQGTDANVKLWLGVLAIVVPGLLGIFWGAPLIAREVEAGTHRLAWTQSITRTRWAATKLLVLGLAAMGTAALLSLMLTWWASPYFRAGMSRYSAFDQRDIVPIGYAAFAFTLGGLLGVLIRRTVPAMAATLVGFVAAQLAFAHLVRPRLFTPAQRAYALNPSAVGYGSFNSGPANLMPNPQNIPNAWITSDRIVDRAGHPLPPSVVAKACPTLGQGGPGGPAAAAPSGGGILGQHTAVRGRPSTAAINALQRCAEKLGATYHQVVSYQPASRYWAFQWTELGIYLGVALVLGTATVWWVRRRLA